MQMQSVRNERGDCDLRGAFKDAFMELGTFFKIALDVFDGDDRVVNEDADGEREAAESHDIDGLAEQAEDDDGRKNRKRDGDRDDERRAPTAEEEQDHQAGKHGGDDGFSDDALHGGFDEDGLV